LQIARSRCFIARMSQPSRTTARTDQAPCVPVHDNPSRRRLEVELEGTVSYADYVLGEGTITFTHTLVPEAQRGRGIGTRLVQAGLAAAQAQHREVIPQCSMFADYMRRRPETHALLAPAGRTILNLSDNT
jgi:predicted GNAT family acetyltransferase